MQLIVVSNRLPFEFRESGGRMRVKQSTGGVATGINSYIASRRKETENFQHKWVGWPGEIAPEKFAAYSESVGDTFVPVFLSPDQMEKFYDGFCNKTLWPLFHSFPMLTQYDDEYWRVYVEVNIEYCNRIAEIVKPGDIIFVNDYHLMLLPRLLRDLFPENQICFFLHIPFPHFELFRLLPGRWRADLLAGLVAADLVGFHTHEYREHFLHCVRRILGFEHALGEITVQDRVCKAETFPMGIDYDLYAGDGAQAGQELSVPGLRKILSIDRLDYTKGILNRLEGYRLFLEKFPAMHGRVQLHVVAVPSRVGVDKYQDLKTQLDEQIGRINGRFSRADWAPIFYQYTNLSTREVIGLYRTTDIALVTPLRDGMNLIAKEYLAARTDGSGVLILSEMAGAAGELTGAIMINPNSCSEIADAIKQALEIPRSEQIERNEPMRAYLREQNIHSWLGEIMECLNETQQSRNSERKKYLAFDVERSVVEAYRSAKRRSLFLDYDGTLVGFAAKPEDAVPGPGLISVLQNLCDDARTDLFIVSGRNREFLSLHFADKRIGLVAEHGAFYRPAHSSEWTPLVPAGADWFLKIAPIMQKYHRRLPGTTIEQKERSIVFHYRRAQGDMGFIRERILELYDTLLQFTASMNIDVIQGNNNVEVRNNGVNKGVALMALSRHQRYDFILAAGDDTTDEDMFRMLPATSHTIKVGRARSAARYILRDQTEVISFLAKLSAH
ncbi:bifunctional alpha,alpha-trehalose-phosphate synthase (UDP-forming)/trehalose-phosphatase [Turneriella parva]|uniref:Trehalose-phosphatase n=1 Tax=Turneriella parva (strain ATCC BAA-1111 / DSM 21527 / NCTC 11395 / H) TaxID=869212 RepID=I4B187_TURPD|nr:bifunctional alpha,alpha-trehalose-phosphate synthase (UDP-forming)/trehalose-phosphatase [Turneriella parva]AFM11044.1 trehalose-phosphatase [Turneriella parva DSM 21527]